MMKRLEVRTSNELDLINQVVFPHSNVQLQQAQGIDAKKEIIKNSNAKIAETEELLVEELRKNRFNKRTIDKVFNADQTQEEKYAQLRQLSKSEKISQKGKNLISFIFVQQTLIDSAKDAIRVFKKHQVMQSKEMQRMRDIQELLKNTGKNGTIR